MVLKEDTMTTEIRDEWARNYEPIMLEALASMTRPDDPATHFTAPSKSGQTPLFTPAPTLRPEDTDYHALTPRGLSERVPLGREEPAHIFDDETFSFRPIERPTRAQAPPPPMRAEMDAPFPFGRGRGNFRGPERAHESSK